MLQILVYSTIAYETPSESGGDFFVEIFRGIEVSLKKARINKENFQINFRRNS